MRDVLTPNKIKNQAEEEENELEYPEDHPIYLSNGLPRNYASMTKPGDPDGTDPANPVVIYADGCFDMYHLGHAKVFE